MEPLHGPVWGEHPQWAVVAQHCVSIYDCVRQFIFVVAIAPPNNRPVDRGIIFLVDQILIGEFFDFFSDRVIHVIVPEPFLDQVPLAEAELLSVV